MSDYSENKTLLAKYIRVVGVNASKLTGTHHLLLSSRTNVRDLNPRTSRFLGNCSCIALITYILVAIPMVEMTGKLKHS